MPEPKIERYETITVETTQKNQYGDLMVNGTLKIGKKRSNLFDVCQPGAEIKLGYASYMNKEYIATAEQTGKHIVPEDHLVKAAKEMGAVPVDEIRKDGFKPQPSPQDPQSKSTPLPDKMTPELWDAKESRTRKSIERQKSLELVINLVIADKIPLQEASTWVLKFERYLESGK